MTLINEFYSPNRTLEDFVLDKKANRKSAFINNIAYF